MRLTIRCVLCLAAVCAGCDDLSFDLEGDPIDVPLAQIIEVARFGRGPIPADGEATDTIFAWIPRDANLRTVTFTTTKGGFLDVGGGKELKALAIRSDREENRLVARATFVSDTLPGTAVIRGTLSSFSDTVQVDMQNTSSIPEGG